MAPNMQQAKAGQAVDALIGLGSNIGDKAANIATAIAALAADPAITVTKRSRLYRTPPWGVTDQDWFANACIAVTTTLTPHGLLACCQAIENAMGRVRRLRWGPRVIDVDVLTYDELCLESPDLVLPHPRIGERAFVLAPLADIAPDLAIGGLPVRELLERVDGAGIEPWPGHPGL